MGAGAAKGARSRTRRAPAAERGNGSPLKVASTPERIEAGWWSDTQTRDYFIAEGQDHALYWIYRERMVGAGEEAEPRWYLHWLFATAM